MAAIIAGGEPQRVIMVGDPNQIPPRSYSETATLFNASVTLLDMMRRRDDYFHKDST
jgi:hypothetical protein